MFVKALMSTHVDWVSPETSLHQAAETMAWRDIGFLPVGEDHQFIGVVTDRDLVIRGLAKGLDPESTRVTEVLTDRFVSIHENDSVQWAAQQMEENQIRRLVVLNEQEEMVGIVSLCDIANRGGDDVLLTEIDHHIYEKRVA